VHPPVEPALAGAARDIAAAAGFRVTEEQAGQLAWFVAEMLRWNERVNLTAVSDEREALDVHVGEALAALTAVRTWLPSGPLLDLGTGPGVPAVPWKVACPALTVEACDAVAKKVAFVAHVGRVLGLTGFIPVQRRAGTGSSFAGRFDAVVTRASARPSVAARVAAAEATAGGRVILLTDADAAISTPAGTIVVDDCTYPRPGRRSPGRAVVMVGRST
jgi:16S rRNA (guanine527-N7)-methyltransferase